jgi:pimeloyl-ACP methyl ester carboxylesterase
MAKWWGLAGLLAWAAGTVLAARSTDEGIRTTPVALQLGDGTTIHGTLYRGSDSPGPAVVVLHGTGVSHHSCGPGLSIPLARYGLTVLAIDLRGHGRSGGALPRSEFDDLETMLNSQADHPEVEAAMDYLRALPCVRGDRIALVGHSRGGWAAACVGCRRQDVASVVAISSGPAFCHRDHPPYLLLVAGGWDEVIPPRLCETALARATEPQDISTQGFSKPALGSPRRLTNAKWCLHITTVAAPCVTESVVWWVAWSFSMENRPVGRDRVALAWWGNILASLAGLAAATVLLRALATWLLPPTAAALPRAARAVKALWLLLVLLTAPVSEWLADYVADGGLLFSAHAVVALGVAGLVVVVVAWLASPGRWAVTECNLWWRGIVLGLVAAALMLALLGGTWGTTWLQLITTPRRLVISGLLIGPIFFCSLALAFGIQRLLGPGGATWKGAGLRGLAWVALSAALWISHIALMRNERPLLAIPTLLVALSCVVPLPLWLLEDRPGLSVARALSHAIAAGCFLGWHLPFVC